MDLGSRMPMGAPGRPLSGRVAVVTGSTSGIGLAIARALAMGGAAVMLNGLTTPEEAEVIVDDVSGSSGSDVAFSGADMTDPDSIADMIDAVLERFGRLDILVNNAGIQHVAPIDQLPPAKWDQILAINLTSAFHTSRLALPLMRRHGWGRVINVASAHGLVGSAYKSAYVAAKHGIVGLTKVIALETAEDGITCNAICPGYVWTPLVEAQIAGQAESHGISRDAVVRTVLLAQQPNKRFATTDEIGALALFLASDAATSITGAALPIDGGWVAQ